MHPEKTRQAQTTGNSKRRAERQGTFSRREFVRRGALLAGAAAATPFAVDLAGVTGAAGASTSDGYKALVCVFMLGGNDHYNTIVPYDQASYNAYAAARGDLAHSRQSLRPLNPTGGFNDGRSVAFANELSSLHALFGQGAVALVPNVGALVQSIRKFEYGNAAKVPKQLFSHNDQQSMWQSLAPEGASTGWGGRIADLMLDDNGQHSAFTSISAGGNAVFLAGREATQFHVSPSGIVQLDMPFNSPAVQQGLNALMSRAGGDDLYTQAYSDITRRALGTASFLKDAVRQAGGVQSSFPDGLLGGQLRAVAELIVAGRNVLGLKRQVFFVGLRGFDVHDTLATTHRELLRELDAGLSAFYRATVQLGLADEVTTFTASDFGRSLVTNGTGSDHGWGSHHLVMGGAVNGGRSYGELPIIANDGPHDVGQGRLIPTTSVEQYAATLATWMGASSNELSAVLPSLDRFEVSDLGFMKNGSEGLAGSIGAATRTEGFTTANEILRELQQRSEDGVR